MYDLIFVGMNPSNNKKGISWVRFYAWLDYLKIDKISFTNLSYDSYWNKKFDTLDHEFVVASVQEYKKIVAWGTLVSDCLKRLDFSDHFILPHPSGLNRQLNDKEYVKMKLELCKEYIYG